MNRDAHPSMTKALGLVLLAVSLGGTVDEASPLPEPAQDEPLPFDPLSHDERQRAVETSLRDEDVAGMLSGRYEVIGASLYTHKSLQDLEDWPRLAETWIYDHGSALTAHALVDLDLLEVVWVEALSLQPPLTTGEVDRAGRLALGEALVRDRLADAGIDTGQVTWTGRLWTGEAGCMDHRCVLVGFSEGHAFFHDHTVVVDLTDEQVRGFLDGIPSSPRADAAHQPGGPT